MHPSSPSARAGVPLLVLAGVLWGTGGLLGALLATTTGLSPLAVAGYRLLTGGGLLLVGLIVLRRPWPRGPAARRRIVLMALLAAVFQAGFFAAVALTSVAAATLVTIGASPVLVLLAERLRGRPGAAHGTAACALAVGGLALLVGTPGTVSLGGVACALVAAAGFAAMTLVAARPVPGLEATTATATSFTLGGTVLLGVAAALGGITFAPDARSLTALVALAVVPTALAYTAFFTGLRRASPGTAAVTALLEPVTAAALAALLLGEHLSAAGLVGGALIATAVLVIALPGRPRGGRPVRRRRARAG